MNWQEPQVRLAYRRPRQLLDLYQQVWNERSQKYPLSTEDISMYDNIVEEIETKGYHIIPNFFKDIDTLAEQINERFETGNGTKNSERAADIRERNNHQIIVDPLYTAPEISDYVFNDHIMRIAMSYMKCYPALGTLNLRRSFANDVPAEGVQFYHIDPNSPRFLKFFTYLNDVNNTGDGPFTYVATSNRKLHERLYEYHRVPDQLAEEMYGQENVTYLTAKKGDLIIADTTGLHKGTKCISSDRTMLTINYVIHPEEFQQPTFNMRQETFDNLPDYKKPLCDFVNKKV